MYHPEKGRTQRSGFALSEALVLITIICIIGILGLQLYLRQEAASQARRYEPSVTPMAESGEMVMDDESMPAGAPSLSTENEYLSITFGALSEQISVLIPGRIVSTPMPDATTGRTIPILTFLPQE